MLYLVRHARTAENARRLLLGRSDPPLDEHGRRQARALPSILTVDLVVSSPLRRAVQTAEVLGEVRTDERFLEVDYGAFEGRPVDEVPAETWRRWRDDPDFAPPGGESLSSVGERVREALTELVAVAAERDVAVVSHVSPVKAGLTWALGVGDEVGWRTWVANCSVTGIDTSGPVPVLRSFNRVPELDPDPRARG